MNSKEATQGFSISSKSACIIGCGGLGCNISVHLVGAGIGRLVLCDFDKVSRGNLNRQFLYTPEDIGQSKCRKAAERLGLYSPHTELLPVEKEILTTDDMSFAKDCSIILCAVDNAPARRVITEFSVKEKIPVVFGGINGFYGMSYLFVPDISPCPCCAGINEEAEARYNVSSTAGIIGSAQAALATEYLLTENAELSGKILIYDEGRFDTLAVSPAEDCRICRKIKNNHFQR